jgi:hypothetical protein
MRSNRNEAVGSVDWREWDPFNFDEQATLSAALSTIPRAPIQKVPLLVRVMENPTSPVALSGATTMFDHDCIHVALGRGLLSQDEGFVIGYSIGNSSNSSAQDRLIFREIAGHYPKPFNLSDQDMLAFDHGFDCGLHNNVRDIHLFDFSAHLEEPIGTVRKLLGVSRERIVSWFREELSLVPRSKESRRLKSHFDG